MTESAYIPGMCNINQKEIAYRRKAMWFGVGVSILVFGVSLALGLAGWLAAIFLFVPVYIATINFLQVRNKFCVRYGSSGQQNADDGSDSAQLVADDSARVADKRKTRTMNFQALGATVLILILSGLVVQLA